MNHNAALGLEKKKCISPSCAFPITTSLPPGFFLAHPQHFSPPPDGDPLLPPTDQPAPPIKPANPPHTIFQASPSASFTNIHQCWEPMEVVKWEGRIGDWFAGGAVVCLRVEGARELQIALGPREAENPPDPTNPHHP